MPTKNINWKKNMTDQTPNEKNFVNLKHIEEHTEGEKSFNVFSS